MIKKTKTEADKWKLHPKNPSVAPSVDVYNNQSSQSLSLWSWREILECLLQAMKYRAQQLPNHTTCDIISRPPQDGVRIMWTNGFTFHSRTSICQKLPADFEENSLLYNNKWLDSEKAQLPAQLNRKYRQNATVLSSTIQLHCQWQWGKMCGD
jgi:hypothetical protein